MACGMHFRAVEFGPAAVPRLGVPLIRDTVTSTQAILDAAFGPALAVDAAGEVLCWNVYAEQVFGYTAAEAVGRKMVELLIPPPLQAGHASSLRATLQRPAAGSSGPKQFLAQGKTGRQFPARITLRRVPSPAGEDLFVAFLQDLSDESDGRAELQRRVRLAEFAAQIGRYLVSAAPLDIILQAVAEETVQQFDAAFVRIWVLPADDDVLRLQASAGLYTHLDGAHAMIRVGQFKIGAVAAERVPHVSHRIADDPCIHDQEWARREGLTAFAGYPLIADDRVMGVLGLFARHALPESALESLSAVASSVAMVIERKEAGEELVRSEERLRMAIDGAELGTWEWIPGTGGLTCNDRWSRMLGYGPGELVVTFDTWEKLVCPEDQPAVRAALSAHLRGATELYRSEHRLRARDGTWKWVLAVGRVAERGLDGSPLRVAGVSLDITERKRLETQLKQSEKLEAIGHLAAGVAHEINTPIQFVNDSVHFVKDGLDDLLPLIGVLQAQAVSVGGAVAESAAAACEKVDLDYLNAHLPKALQRSVDGLARVAEIVRAMKEFAHPDQNDMGPFDLNRALQNTLTITRAEWAYVADMHLDLADIPLVMCHGGEIKQVLLNLIVNAAHAIGEREKKTAGRGRIAIRTRSDGPDVVVSISDTGNGIPAAVQHRVFEPFFTTKEVGKGTGQGLAIARHVVAVKHGGQITFETAPATGTTFHVRLPVAGPRPQPQPDPAH